MGLQDANVADQCSRRSAQCRLQKRTTATTAIRRGQRMINDNQKPVTDKYRNNWEQVFKKSSITTKPVELEDYQKLAQEIWFKDGSCTGGKPE